MANQHIQEGKYPITVLGGLNELTDSATDDPSEIASMQNILPEMTGMIMRMFGKLTISKNDGQIRAIHQYFNPFGYYGQFIEYNDRLEMGSCRDNLSFSSYYNRPNSLGVDANGKTLNTFGLVGDSGSMVLALTSLEPIPPCMMGTTVTPPVTASYKLDTPGVPSTAGTAPNYASFVGLRLTIRGTSHDYILGDDFEFGDVLDFTNLITSSNVDASIFLQMIYNTTVPSLAYFELQNEIEASDPEDNVSHVNFSTLIVVDPLHTTLEISYPTGSTS